MDLSDEAFAAQYPSMAFSESLIARERFAWMVCSRVNRPVAVPWKTGMSGSDWVPVWMTWPTDPDTFGPADRFELREVPRTTLRPSVEKEDLEAGNVATADPDGANQEVTRNKASYDSLFDSGLTTKAGVATYFAKHDAVQMPIGSIELKASWLQVTEGSPAPAGALAFPFEAGEDWWRGLHLMVKMRNLPDATEGFYAEEPSWSWSTFEFNGNPGVDHVREALITARAPLPEGEIAAILGAAGLAGRGFGAYATNGTQIRFTVNGAGETPEIPGHTDMEDYAGGPDTALPRSWTHLEASCHSCHATASYNPDTQSYFPFSVPTGALHPAYNAIGHGEGAEVQYLGQEYKPLDFMWPIAFRAR